ncbi:Methyltransferase domain-containing protein [Geodermatophilus amargosae]|uniref:Methyltransferase domain-containing protein n=1 Tax=Geodermatophilus amargosae TaxID=1296565 RepID=A0A1I6X6B9_9ACTN|nr:class I SAM-dependent methyltransferase [Geodermatophilus amargosae]SFT33908.1 Methyltransferase domain-containing protein [Geodermatophilus amargosae]
MFTRSASFYDALYHFVDYEGAARKLHGEIRERAPGASSLLDVGCGTGQHLQRLRQWYEVEGLDLDGGLLNIARQRCPGVPFHEASMVDFDLPRRFDVVTCLFSAIAYVQTVEDMSRTVTTMARHLEPGGLLVVEPWFEPGRYWTDTITANHYDSAQQKICWMYTSKRDGDVSVLDIQYLVGTPDRVEHLVEQHRLGLFTKEQHLKALGDAGLEEATFDEQGLVGRGLYVATKPRR